MSGHRQDDPTAESPLREALLQASLATLDEQAVAVPRPIRESQLRRLRAELTSMGPPPAIRDPRRAG